MCWSLRLSEVVMAWANFLFLPSHAQGLAALQAYCHWMAQYYLETHRQQQHQEKFVTLISQAVDALVPLLNKDVSWFLFGPGLHERGWSLLLKIKAFTLHSFFLLQLSDCGVSLFQYSVFWSFVTSRICWIKWFAFKFWIASHICLLLP